MLNDKQELFVQHYILTRNASEAAKAAGYSERSAYNQGYRLLQDEAVQQRIYDAEQEMTTDVDVISELENQYSYAKGHGHTNSAIKALEILSRVRGNKTNDEDVLNVKKIVSDIQEAMKIIGKVEMQKLMKTCEWD
jgi:phage terminase small subunit|tara:strand:+ start:629 stop:1036 length:408 start_codon:yes stop_codon:yes gene_type:complete